MINKLDSIFMMKMMDCPYCMKKAIKGDLLGNLAFLLGDKKCLNCKKSISINVGTSIILYLGMWMTAGISFTIFIFFVDLVFQFFGIFIGEVSSILLLVLTFIISGLSVYLYLRYLNDRLELRVFLPKN